MAKPSERALKRKPMAVILLTTKREDVPNVPSAGREYEWFDTEENMHKYFDQNDEYHVSDTTEYDDMAYLAVEVTNTATLEVGRVSAHPESEATKAWAKAIKGDITKSFEPPRATKSATDKGATTKRAVRPRKPSTAAAAVRKDDPDAKKEALKKRLDAKKATQAKPTAKRVAKKPAAKKEKTPDGKGEVIEKGSPEDEERIDNKVRDMEAENATS